MSFEVVASSRLEERKTTSWRLVVNTGLQMGGTGLALALVGILSMFNNRPIIVGVLTLGYATLGLLFLVAGILVGYKRPFRAAADRSCWRRRRRGDRARIMVADPAGRHEPRQPAVRSSSPSTSPCSTC